MDDRPVGPGWVWWAGWALASGLWLSFFGGIGLLNIGGVFSEPTNHQRTIGAAFIAIGCAGPVLLLLMRRERRPSWTAVILGATAAGVTGATTALWFY